MDTVLVNPRKRRPSAKKRRNPKRRKRATVARRANPARRIRRRRVRAVARRSNPVRRTRRRVSRKNPGLNLFGKRRRTVRRRKNPAGAFVPALKELAIGTVGAAGAVLTDRFLAKPIWNAVKDMAPAKASGQSTVGFIEVVAGLVGGAALTTVSPVLGSAFGLGMIAIGGSRLADAAAPQKQETTTGAIVRQLRPHVVRGGGNGNFIGPARVMDVEREDRIQGKRGASFGYVRGY